MKPAGEAAGTTAREQNAEVTEQNADAGCPTCGAAADQCVFYETDAFCMECGEVFSCGKPQGTVDYFALSERSMDEM